MFYVGLDVHQRTSSYCILDENGKVVNEQKVRGDWDLLLSHLAGGPLAGQRWAVCFEASCGYGALHDQLRCLGAQVVVAHPGKLRLIFRSKKKNDRVDARKLAKLLFLDEVPAVWVPGLEIRQWRELVEYRRRLVAKRTRTKNALRALLRGYGIQKMALGRTPRSGPATITPSLPAPSPAATGGEGSAPRKLDKSLWAKQGLKALKALSLPTPMAGVRRDLLVEELEQFNAQVQRLEKELDALAEKHPGVVLLQTIPGVGVRTAEAAVAYVGDPQRFRQNKAIGAYAGLVPCQDASAAVNRLGHITRDGPGTLRWLLIEAAWQGIRRSATLKAFYQRVRHERPDRGKIALVATGHYLLRVMLALLKTGEVWRETVPVPGAALKQTARDRRVAALA
jgi:transposase